MTLLRHLQAAWQYAINMPRYNEEADHEDFWSKADSEAYTNFMKSPTGQKLRLRQRNFMYRCAVSANQASQHQKHRCGWSNGITASFSWLDSHLLSPSSAHDEPEQSEQGAADMFDQFAP